MAGRAQGRKATCVQWNHLHPGNLVLRTPPGCCQGDLFSRGFMPNPTDVHWSSAVTGGHGCQAQGKPGGYRAPHEHAQKCSLLPPWALALSSLTQSSLTGGALMSLCVTRNLIR